MLVSLANQVGFSAGVGQTFTYSPKSVQKVFIHTEDTSGNDAWDGTVTVQIGQKTVVNGADMFGLVGQTMTLCGNPQYDEDSFIELDFGSIQCLDNDNLYVTILPNNIVTGIDISAIVDEAGTYPLKYTEYSDTTFTAQNVLKAFSFDSAEAVVDDDNYVCEIRTNIYSSAPTFTSANSYFRSKNLTSYLNIAGSIVNSGAYFGLLALNAVPLDTTFNYSSSAVTDKILVISAMPNSMMAKRQSKKQANLVLSQIKKGFM